MAPIIISARPPANLFPTRFLLPRAEKRASSGANNEGLVPNSDNFVPERTATRCDNISRIICGTAHNNSTTSTNKSSLLGFCSLHEKDLLVQCFKQTSVKCVRDSNKKVGKGQFPSAELVSEANCITLEIR